MTLTWRVAVVFITAVVGIGVGYIVFFPSAKKSAKPDRESSPDIRFDVGPEVEIPSQAAQPIGTLAEDFVTIFTTFDASIDPDLHAAIERSHELMTDSMKQDWARVFAVDNLGNTWTAMAETETATSTVVHSITIREFDETTADVEIDFETTIETNAGLSGLRFRQAMLAVELINEKWLVSSATLT